MSFVLILSSTLTSYAVDSDTGQAQEIRYGHSGGYNLGKVAGSGNYIDVSGAETYNGNIHDGYHNIKLALLKNSGKAELYLRTTGEGAVELVSDYENISSKQNFQIVNKTQQQHVQLITPWGEGSDEYYQSHDYYKLYTLDSSGEMHVFQQYGANWSDATDKGNFNTVVNTTSYKNFVVKMSDSVFGESYQWLFALDAEGHIHVFWYDTNTHTWGKNDGRNHLVGNLEKDINKYSYISFDIDIRLSVGSSNYSDLNGIGYQCIGVDTKGKLHYWTKDETDYSTNAKWVEGFPKGADGNTLESLISEPLSSASFANTRYLKQTAIYTISETGKPSRFIYNDLPYPSNTWHDSGNNSYYGSNTWNKIIPHPVKRIVDTQLGALFVLTGRPADITSTNLTQMPSTGAPANLLMPSLTTVMLGIGVGLLLIIPRRRY